MKRRPRSSVKATRTGREPRPTARSSGPAQPSPSPAGHRFKTRWRALGFRFAEVGHGSLGSALHGYEGGMAMGQDIAGTASRVGGSQNFDLTAAT
jgi:hypothetical protein